MKPVKTLFAATLMLAASFAQADPVAVNFTTTGSAGNWLYNFSVTNNLGGTNNVYFFGVKTPGIIVSSPSGYAAWNSGSTWTSADSTSYGGPSIDFNNAWIGGKTLSGQTLSGFEVSDSSLVAQTAISWFAYAQGGNYTGGGNYNNNTNPGFAGTAGSVTTSVPEPGTLALLGLGLMGLVAGQRKTQKHS